MSYTETKEVTHLNAHRVKVGGRVYALERTCRNFGGEEGTNGEGYDFACDSCGWCGSVCGPNFCPSCGAKVVKE